DHLENEEVLNSRSLLLLTSDHGERFYEHGSWIHGPPDVYNEVLRIPLMIKGPGIRAGVCDWNVQLADIFPTLRQWCGDPLSNEMVGQSLIGLLNTNERDGSLTGRVIYSDGTGKKPHYSYIRDKTKVIVNGDKTEVYNLEEDPLETVNLRNKKEYRQLIADARDYRKTFKRIKKRGPKKRERMTDKERERLKTLGYVK
ncbi:MAG: hypothetical protein GY940_46620, partial [bacterium]|nr:hypothetical protein [bacterium]